MKFEDTVMSQEELNHYWLNPSECDAESLAEAQAEISFKAGMKEVVDYVRINITTGFPNDTIINWQAKLKEWGIE